MHMLFDGWTDLIRVLVIGTLAYIGLVVLLRISGNRTLSKMNSFDLVVTIAFGSALASALLDKKIALAEGLVAIALLVLLQFIVTWLSVRFASVNGIVKSRPTMLLRDGQLIHEALKTARVTEDEIFAAVRQHGMGGLEQIAAVVLETDGSLSVIAQKRQGSASALEGVSGR
jgi:uncharacterized membrane protein YcaP (DUF421 family)